MVGAAALSRRGPVAVSGPRCQNSKMAPFEISDHIECIAAIDYSALCGRGASLWAVLDNGTRPLAPPETSVHADVHGSVCIDRNKDSPIVASRQQQVCKEQTGAARLPPSPLVVAPLTRRDAERRQQQVIEAQTGKPLSLTASAFASHSKCESANGGARLPPPLTRQY